MVSLLSFSKSQVVTTELTVSGNDSMATLIGTILSQPVTVFFK